MGPAPAPSVQRLGRYEVVRHLASGGMAEIYLARDGRETVVIKLIAAERDGDKKFIQMFLDEARVAATLHHPNIAQMLEVGRQGDTYFLAMEFIDGDTVRAMLERAVTSRARIPVPVCLHIVMAVAAGLHHAHERKGATGDVMQIVHRDVTPSNVMVGWDGTVKLLDFGIARANNRAAETQSGTIKGKFAYMSPEQCRGMPVDRRTDVFALGIVLYEMTTLRRAFRTDSDFETMDRIVKGRLTRPSTIDPNYPLELEEIVLKALATDVSKRYQSADELRLALADYAARRGATATAADLAATMRSLFRGEDPLSKTIEETNSEVEVLVQSDSGDDAAATLPRMAAEPSPAMTGPMPVMPTRPSSQVALPAMAAMAPSGPAVTGPNPIVPRAIPTDEWNAPVKTILGPGPASSSGIRRPPTAGPTVTPAPSRPAAAAATDTAPVAALPPAADFVAVNEPTHVRRAQRRGLRLALIAIVVVAAITAAVLALAGGGAAGGAVAPAQRAAP